MPAKKAAKKATAKKAAVKAPTKKQASPEVAIQAKKAAKKAVTTKKTASVAPIVPSTEAIARQAYLNYLQRVQNGLPGDSHGDWLTAEKQLTKG